MIVTGWECAVVPVVARVAVRDRRLDCGHCAQVRDRQPDDRNLIQLSIGGKGGVRVSVRESHETMGQTEVLTDARVAASSTGNRQLISAKISDSVPRRTRAASRDLAFRFSVFFRTRPAVILLAVGSSGGRLRVGEQGMDDEVNGCVCLCCGRQLVLQKQRVGHNSKQ